MKDRLTYLEAFRAMTCFLEKFYEQTSSADIGSLLGEIQILQDEKTADPAAWEDWMNCIQKTNQKDERI